MATLPRAVASPASYVVCPVEVISMGAFSGVLISPLTKLAPVTRAARSRSSFRMADAEGITQQTPSAKQKHFARRRRKSANVGITSTIIESIVANRRLVD